MEKEMTPAARAERSVITTYRCTIWNRFIGAIRDYRLISPGDRIGVCISGGKDSALMAVLFSHLQKYSEFPFEVRYICMDPGYTPENRQLIEHNMQTLGIDAQYFETSIFRSVESVQDSPCYLCARLRRGYLYSCAQELGCNKIALGHHFDDVIETTLMSMLYGAEVKTMMPKLHADHFENMELIRPLYLVREHDILAWKNYNGLRFLQCACRFTQDVADQYHDSKRLEVKNLIAAMKKVNPQVDINIFRSMENVNVGQVIATKKNKVKKSFLEDYDK